MKKKAKKKILEYESLNDDVDHYHWKLTFKRVQVDLDSFPKIIYVKPFIQWEQLLILHAGTNFSKHVVVLPIPVSRTLTGNEQKIYVLCMETTYGLFIRNAKELQHEPIILSKLQETLNARAV